jgi:outer membrane biogenesis lipoprotein LolB
VIDYSNWQADPGSGIELPSRINAEQASNRVRLVVDRWGNE